MMLKLVKGTGESKKSQDSKVKDEGKTGSSPACAGEPWQRLTEACAFASCPCPPESLSDHVDILNTRLRMSQGEGGCQVGANYQPELLLIEHFNTYIHLVGSKVTFSRAW